MLIYPTLEIFAKLQQESRKWMNVVRAFEKSITNPKKYARSIESGLTYWCASIVPENTAEFMHSRMYQSVIYVLAGRLVLSSRIAAR
ncbi:hypothetical protein [Arcanobacterium hippocoleae]|uniref:hypothetical protein n=1 Tax=Arcanobacterium hippocoleae TaxID=149017 RepID=UPI00333EF622